MTMTVSYAFDRLYDLTLPTYQNTPASQSDTVGLPDGRFATVADGDDGHTQVSIYDATGNVRLSESWFEGTHSRVAALPNGDIVIIGDNTTGGTNFHIDNANAVNAANGSVSVGFNADVAGLASGNFVIVSQAGMTQTDIDFAIYDSTGHRLTGTYVDGTAADDINASVAGLADGGFAVAWERQFSGSTEVFYAVYNADGSVRQEVTDTGLSSASDAVLNVTALPNGGFSIGSEYVSGGSPASIAVTSFDASGKLLSFIGGVDTSDQQTEPAVTTLSNGLVMSTFTDNYDSGQGIFHSVQGALLDPSSGTALTSLTAPSTLAGGDGTESQSSVSAMELAQFAVSYTVASLGEVHTSVFQLVRNAIGDASDDVFTGDDARDVINGMAGNDRLDGGANNDVLSGGDGFDVLSGGAGNDNLNGGTGIDTLFGDASNDSLNGGTGGDVLIGGGGNDLYIVDDAADHVTEANGEGTDTVYATVSYTLASGQSIDTLATSSQTGTSAINLTGNNNANHVFGNNGGNVISGAGGVDLLFGYGGNDTIIGGAASDTIDTGNGRDVVRFNQLSDSTGVNRDVIYTMNLGATDKFDFPVVPTSIHAEVTTGSLSTASFDSDLAAAIHTSSQLGAHQAVLFDPNGGDLNVAGHLFLIVDVNGQAGYQAGADYVVELVNPTGTLTTDDFI